MNAPPAAAAIRPEPSFGFAAWRGGGRHMAMPHVHPDIEFNFVLQGSVEYLMADAIQTIQAGSVGVFWAGMPHLATHMSPDSDIIWVVVPLSWFLQWDLPRELTAELIRGTIHQYTPPDELENRLFARWAKELARPDEEAPEPEVRETAALEVQAFLRRMARQREASPKSKPPVSTGELSQFERIAAYINLHYADENLSVAAVAEAVGLHPNYVMQLFRSRFGTSLWEYVLRIRVSHAQYLLLTSRKKIAQIAHESGFASPARFYTAFAKYAGCTPREWKSKNVI